MPTCSTRLLAETQGFQALLSIEARVACTSNGGCPNALDCVAPGEHQRAFLGHAGRLDALEAHCFARRSWGRTVEGVLSSSGKEPCRFTSSNRQGLHQQHGRASNRAAILDWTCSFFIVSTSLCASWPLSKIWFWRHQPCFQQGAPSFSACCCTGHGRELNQADFY